MKFNPWKCPECGEPARGTVERVFGLALMTFDENGDAGYAGETKIDWNSQTSVLRTTAENDVVFLLECINGHRWQAEQID